MSEYECKPVMASDELLVVASSITIALTNGKSFRELETLVNLFSLIEDNLKAVLAQRAINNRIDPILDIRV